MLNECMMMMMISYILSNIVYVTVSSELLLDTKHYSVPFTRSAHVFSLQPVMWVH